MYKHLQACQAVLHGIESIDFFLAQQICRALNARNDALLFHSVVAISAVLRDGHSCLNLEALAGDELWEDEETGRLGFKFPKVDEWMAHLADLDISPEAGHPIVFQQQRLYLRRYWQFENEAADQLRTLLDQTEAVDLPQGRALLDELFSINPMGDPSTAETDWQKVAVANALARNFTIIAGGPGTGKTYTVTRLLVALQRLHHKQLKIALVAPTGKAAQRLSESIRSSLQQMNSAGQIDAETLVAIPDSASTLHRLLGVKRHSNCFRHDEKNPLNLDLLLVDEVSMIDLPLMTRLLRAMPDHARLVLLGDADQLPSVAAGSVLADLAPRPHSGYSGKNSVNLTALTGYSLPVSEKAHDHLTLLQKGRRFDGEGGIGVLASHVIAGDADASWNLLNGDEEQISRVTRTDFNGWLIELVRRYYLPVLQAESVEAAFTALARFRFLTATRVGPTGVEQINEIIENYLRAHEVIEGLSGHYHGRPIMVTENHYGVGLFNGDVGLLWRNDAGHLLAAFQQADGEIRWISPGRLPKLESVYAMTIHKTQGSEFEHVTLILPEQGSPILSRELLYTGITRASKQFTLWGTESVWRLAVTHRIKRYSGLAERVFGR